MNHLIDPNRREIKPIYDGIPVGAVRSFHMTPIDYCQCENPETEERINRIYNAKYVVCKTCGESIKKKSNP